MEFLKNLALSPQIVSRTANNPILGLQTIRFSDCWESRHDINTSERQNDGFGGFLALGGIKNRNMFANGFIQQALFIGFPNKYWYKTKPPGISPGGFLTQAWLFVVDVDTVEL